MSIFELFVFGAIIFAASFFAAYVLILKKNSKKTESNLEMLPAMKDAFSSIAYEVMEKNNKQIVELARMQLESAGEKNLYNLDKRALEIDSLLKPLSERLGDLEKFNRSMELKREKAYGEIDTHLSNLSKSTASLQKSNVELSTALSGSSQARGRWGEISLVNIVELAGMTEHVDFDTQVSFDGGIRPDMAVKLPGGGLIPVDAKTPFSDYVKYINEPDRDEKIKHLNAHASAVKTQVKNLAKKNYPEHVDGEIDFTVMFIPSDSMLAAAFEIMPDLFSQAEKSNILLATPVTLVALLRTIGIYWRQEKMAENSKKIWQASKELFERILVFQNHLIDLGKNLDKAVRTYNKSVSSYKSRIEPCGQRLQELGIPDSGKNDTKLSKIKTTVITSDD